MYSVQALAQNTQNDIPHWTNEQIAQASSFSLDSLSRPPPLNPSNLVGNQPEAKQLGKRLFFDASLSANGKISCSSCHQPELNFTDGKVLAQGMGTLTRHSPSLLGVAYQSWFYTDGRRDSLWSQAITPFESLHEMGTTRVAVVKYVLNHPDYKKMYKDVFGSVSFEPQQLPNKAGPYGNAIEKKNWRYLSANLKHQVNHTFANIGRVLAAYERDILPSSGRLEAFLRDIKNQKESIVNTRLTHVKLTHSQPDNYQITSNKLSHDEQKGLKLFIDAKKTQCLKCHNGPLFTNGEFHNIGTATLTGRHLDMGRMIGLQAVFSDEFNCYGAYSQIRQDKCLALRFVNREDSHSASLGAFKVPTLRGLAKTAPYGHNGRFLTLKELMDHYRAPPERNIYNHELIPLDLSDTEIHQLIAFLNVL